MNAVWVVLGIGVACVVAALATSWFRRNQDFDLGSVSHQWIAERRLGQGHEPPR